MAILLYDELTAYNGAKEQIVSDGEVIRRGKAVTPPDPISYKPETSIVHAVTRESGDQHFAQTLHGPVHPSQPGAKNKKAMELVEKIGERLQSPDLDVFHQTYETPVIDPMFMEPESGLAFCLKIGRNGRGQTHGVNPLLRNPARTSTEESLGRLGRVTAGIGNAV